MEKTATLTLINSLLIGITVNMTSYGSGQVLLMFDHKNLQVINEFNKIAFDLNSQTQPLGAYANKGISPCTLIFKDFVIAIPVIRRLVTLGYITPADQSQLPALFQDIEIHLNARKKIHFGLKPAQHASLEYLVEDYIDEILDKAPDWQTAIQLLRLAFVKKNYFLSPDKVQAFLAEKKILADFVNTIAVLWRITHGEANLESTYQRLGLHVPNLDIQRFKIRDLCIKKLVKKFEMLTDKEKLIMILGLSVFVTSDSSVDVLVSPLSDTKPLIEGVLRCKYPSIEHQRFFEICPLQSLLGQAFREMGIKPAEDSQRIEALREELQSSVLQTSLENITHAKETQALADANPLLQALTANNLDQVRTVLDAGADVNQFLPGDTRTPLMYALHHCDLTIVKLILNYKPDIHKLNQLGYSNALGIVIGIGDYEKTRLLLEAGANVIRACMYTSTVIKYYDPLNVPMQWVSPSTYAVMKYQQDKENPERLKLVKLLMFYGAFIGTQVKADSLNIFQSCDMLLAGSYPFHAAKFPIVSLNDFKSYISIDDYPHWRTVFSRLMEYNVFHAEPTIQQTLKSALEHIDLQLTRREDSSKTSATNSDTSVSPLLVELAALSENNLNAVITKINMSDYVEALGTACSLSNKELALKVATIILKYKDTLNFNINEPYGLGARTCLHIAGMKGNEALFNLLMSHGADKEALDKKGKTPQQWLDEQLHIKSTMTAAQLKK